jgi:hypothetical protein
MIAAAFLAIYFGETHSSRKGFQQLMTDSTNEIFEELNRVNDRTSAIAAAERLAAWFCHRREYHRLFEARKFAARLRAGVPPFFTQRTPQLSTVQNKEIEAELLAACREVGEQLAISGQPGAAWTYLQPLDDLDFVRNVLEQVPRTEETISDLIQICLFERAHPEFGYGLILQELGTCQAISAFDSAFPGLDYDQRAALAERLIRHMHRELTSNVRSAISRAAPSTAVEIETAELAELLEKHGAAIRQSTPHLDATHLVSAMRIGRLVSTPTAIREALSLARYGELLPSLLQYASEPPFSETYPDHVQYFKALVSGDATEAVARFLERSGTSTSTPDQAAAAEVAVELLLRCGKPEEAAELALRQGPEFGSAGIAPGLIEIAGRLKNPETILKFLREQEDVLAFAAVRLLQASSAP